MPDGATGAESARFREELMSEPAGTGQEHGRPPDVVCSGGLKLPPLALISGPGQERDRG